MPSVMDLKYVYEDKELVVKLKGLVSRVEFNKFLDIRPLTMCSKGTADCSNNGFAPHQLPAGVAAAEVGAIASHHSTLPLSANEEMNTNKPYSESLKQSGELDLARKVIKEEVRSAAAVRSEEDADRRKEHSDSEPILFLLLLSNNILCHGPI